MMRTTACALFAITICLGCMYAFDDPPANKLKPQGAGLKLAEKVADIVPPSTPSKENTKDGTVGPPSDQIYANGTAWTFVVGNQTLLPKDDSNPNALTAKKLWNDTFKDDSYDNFNFNYTYPNISKEKPDYIILRIRNRTITLNADREIACKTIIAHLQEKLSSIQHDISVENAELDITINSKDRARDPKLMFKSVRKIVGTLDDLRMRKYPAWGIIVLVDADLAECVMKIFASLPERCSCIICFTDPTTVSPPKSELNWLLARPENNIPRIYLVKSWTSTDNTDQHLRPFNLFVAKQFCKCVHPFIDNNGNNIYDSFQPNSNAQKHSGIAINIKNQRHYAQSTIGYTAYTIAPKIEDEPSIIVMTLKEIEEKLKSDNEDMRKSAYLLLAQALFRWRAWQNIGAVKESYMKMKQLAAIHQDSIQSAIIKLYEAQEAADKALVTRPPKE